MNAMVTVIPVKDTRLSKQRTSRLLDDGKLRQTLALTMLEDVLEAVAPTHARSTIVLVTVDEHAIALARKYAVQTTDVGAHDGHTGSVTQAAASLQRNGATGFLTIPADIPLIATCEVEQLLDAHNASGPAFTIAPSHDELGSNAIACSPVDAVPLRFGDDSYHPHVEAARSHGIEPTVLQLPGIAQDIDTPEDIARFMDLPRAKRTRTYAYLKSTLPALNAATESQP